MSKKSVAIDPNNLYVIYRQNKGYFYGPGAGAKLIGKAINWGANTPNYLALENSSETESYGK